MMIELTNLEIVSTEYGLESGLIELLSKRAGFDVKITSHCHNPYTGIHGFYVEPKQPSSVQVAIAISNSNERKLVRRFIRAD